MLDVPSVFLLQGGVTLLVRLDPGGGDNAPKMRNKGQSFHKHALSFANSIEKTAVATPGGQEEGDATGAYPINNTEVVSKLRERARDDNVTILVVDSAESLLAYINGPASIAKLVVFNLHVSLSVSC